MAATKQEIREWLEEGKKKNAAHVIVMCDTYDYEDYPVYVLRNQDPRLCARQGEMQAVMEVYNLSLDIETQLNTHRVKNW